MSELSVFVLLIVAGLVAWAAFQSIRAQKRSEAVESQMAELRRDLQAMATAQAQSSGQLTAFAGSVNSRLDSVSKSLTDGVAQSADISAKSQAAMSEDLKNTQGIMERIHRQLGEFQETSRGLANAQQSLEAVLGNAKARGILGEVTLQRLLEDSLPLSQYAMQFRFSSGETVDAAIFLRDKKLLAIDSKFPLDAFRRIQTDGDEARRAFVTAVKTHADSMAKKYILPAEDTLDLALMFVPSESVYAELLQSTDSKGQQLDAYCRERRIIAVSPNTLYAHLCVVAMGLRGMQIEENARRLANGLSGLQRQLGNFVDTFEKVGTHLKNAQNSYLEAGRRLDKTELALEGMVEGGSVGAGEQTELPLAASASEKSEAELPPLLRLSADSSR